MWFLSKKSLEKDFQNVRVSGNGSLKAIDLTVAGLGAMIGCGVFTLTGIVASHYTGPAVVLSYVIAGIATIIVALLYAELASAFPSSGSIYTYGSLAFGEFIGWMAFSVLVMEMTFSAVSVASALGSYFVALLENMLGLKLPSKYLAGPFGGGIINIPAILVPTVFGLLTLVGKGSKTWVNNALVAVKALTIVLFVVLALPYFDVNNLKDFMPFGIGRTIAGGSILFFAFTGFTVIPTLADSCQNPSRDTVVGILGSVFITMAVYIVVSLLAVGFCHYSNLDGPESLFRALESKYTLGTRFMGLGVIAGMLAVFLIVFNTLVRVLSFVARDGLLPAFFKEKVSFGKSIGGTLFCTFVCALLAGTMRYDVAAQACSIGSLGDYTIAAMLVVLFRRRYPNVVRSFKCPFIYLIGAAGTLVSTYLLYKQIVESDRAVGMVVMYWLLGSCAFYWIYAFSRRKCLNGNSSV